MGERVLIAGSRSWFDYDRIYTKLGFLPEGTTIVHGGAAGADRLAARAARAFGFDVEEWCAEWEKYGKKAGVIRNCAMLDSGPDRVIAFWDGASRGTKHTITEAERRGIPVEVLLAPHLPTDPEDA